MLIYIYFFKLNKRRNIIINLYNTFSFSLLFILILKHPKKKKEKMNIYYILLNFLNIQIRRIDNYSSSLSSFSLVASSHVSHQTFKTHIRKQAPWKFSRVLILILGLYLYLFLFATILGLYSSYMWLGYKYILFFKEKIP